jgi:5-methylcytosine-specific restriction endonuclease McrA
MDKCPDCGNKIETENRTIAEYHFCNNCGFEHIDYPLTCCLFPKIIPVRFYSDEIEAFRDSDNYVIYNQCQNCGRRVGKAISKSRYEKNEIPQSNNSIVEKSDLIKKELQELSKSIQTRKIQRKRETFWDDIDDYLKSERWQNIRKIVLKRDNYMCQSCFNAKAEQVHHLDGRFRKNEPLFTLVSVCNRCHDIITEIERGNHRLAQKIKYEFDK